MNRSILAGVALLLLVAPVGVMAAPSAGVQPAVNQIGAGQLAGFLVDAAHRLPPSALENDYLQSFLAEIASSGASQVVVASAIDKAVGVRGMSKGAVQALEALRKRSRQFDYTTASGKGGVFGAPAFTSGGGSDYVR